MERGPYQGSSIDRRSRLEDRNHDGHSYRFEREDEHGVKHVTCRFSGLYTCRGTAEIVNGEWRITREHTHPPIQNRDEYERFLRELYHSTMTEPKSLATIYADFKELYPIAASIKTEKETIHKMKRWRATARPPNIPNTFAKLNNLVHSRQWAILRAHEKGVLEFELKQENDEEVAIICYDAEFIRKLEFCTEIYVSTAKCTTSRHLNGANELVTVIAVYCNYAFLCVWAWLKRRTTGAYNAIVAPLEDIVNVQTAFVGFDARAHDELHNIFPNATINGDFYSYSTILLSKVKALNLDIENDSALKSTVRQIIALALLPSDDVLNAYKSIEEELTEEHRLMLVHFLSYYEVTWIETITARGFSVFKNPDALMDAALTQSKTLNFRLGNNASKPWDFVRSFGAIQTRSIIDFERINSGKAVTTTPRIRPLINLKDVRHLWGLRESNEISGLRFVELASVQLENFVENLIFYNDHQEVSDFIPSRFSQQHVNGDAREIEGVVNGEEVVIEVLEDNDMGLNNDMESPYDWTCVVCKSTVIEYACVPCMHVAFCQECSARTVASAEALNRQLTCPLCRTPVDEIKRVYIPARQ